MTIVSDAPSQPRADLGGGAARLAAEGANELPQPDRRTLARIVLEVLREPMLALLLGGGAIYLALGDTKEAVILLVFACLSVVITVVQEARTERVLEALRDLTSPRALVIRDGERRRIPGREVVRGDVIVLAEGDRVPADARLIEAQDLQADESLLTGESAPVRKLPSSEASPADRRPGGDDQPMVYSGALIVRGGGLAEVTATGARSEIGKIGKSLGSLETEAPRLQQQTRRLVMIAAVFGGAVSTLVVALYWILRGNGLDALLAGIAIGMSMLPEEFPVVLTVFMAMGAWRISQARVLTRRATAIESLGSATVLCTDKTGTLTQNRMTIAQLRCPLGERFDIGPDARTLPPAAEKILAFGVLASAREPFDPMEKAFHALALRTGASPPSGDIVRAYPLRPDLSGRHPGLGDGGDAGQARRRGQGRAGGHRGALPPCRRRARKTGRDGRGYGRLGPARPRRRAGRLRRRGPAERARRFRLHIPRSRWPRRPDPRRCSGGGRRMPQRGHTRGDDHRRLSRYGLGHRAPGGHRQRRPSHRPGDRRPVRRDLVAHVRKTSVFARIMPDQKLRIVEALKASGEIVAMTGDGVNDALSLKAAHIGVAMGGRGTDVAREASSIVLLDDDFGSIVKTVRLGRRIYDNLRKAMSFIFAVHVPIAGLALAPLLLGAPMLFGPVHIAFLEMVIDPVCSLVFEAEIEEDGLMRRPPRDPAEPLFSLPMILWGLFQGAFALALVAGNLHCRAAARHAGR